jgi:peroxiredoxin Q/BCP
MYTASKINLAALMVYPRRKTLSIGDFIPDFELYDQEGRLFSTKAHANQPLVIFFYPKDFTPGCTAQVCSFRDYEQEFAATGAKVLGINSGSVKEHQSFVNKHDLNFPLLSDPNHNVRNSFGAPGLFFNRVADRATFVTDAQHRIVFTFKSLTKATQHVNESLNFLQNLDL